MRYFIVAAIILAGCVAVDQESSFVISYTVEDSPKDERIYVRFYNDRKRAVCLYPTNWPDEDGHIESGNGRVFINVYGKKYSTTDFDGGYCPGCSLRINPKQEIMGFFKYSDFKIPSEYFSIEKSLEFSPTAFYCSSR